MYKDGEPISGIRVHFGKSGDLTSLQALFGTSWSSRFGIPKGSTQEILLKKDEFIGKVTGSNDKLGCIRYISFETNQGRKLKFGKVGKNIFKEFSSTDGAVLNSIAGMYRPGCIAGLSFNWESIKTAHVATTEKPAQLAASHTTQKPAHVATTQKPAHVATTQKPAHVAKPTTQKPAHVAKPTTQKPAHVAKPTTQKPAHVAKPTTQESVKPFAKGYDPQRN
ncbi:uncharacterized protein LOC103092152 [Monodelphis domestica]|uniref:uncharacterized protein LOC103092152 n=1 Tax=Monodelphis domestica TaxID=13616 RepID=UPI00044342D2|nr:uncharacterized protein LOC103092152 [Monodelphis domestica]